MEQEISDRLSISTNNHRAKKEAERIALLEQQKAEELPGRDRLFKITANAAQALLNHENLDNAIARALQIIGEGIDTDRVSVMEHCEDSTGESLGYAKMLFEWHSIHAISQLHHPNLQQVSYEGIESWYEQLNKGEVVGRVIEEIPEPVRSGQKEIGVKSLYSVPITIDGKYWGLIGFDDCREAKQRSETEISILKTTAACIGSAIQQSRIREEGEQAERQILLEQQRVTQLQEHNQVLEQREREVQRSYRILAATAQASNVLLTGEDFDKAVNKALEIIGISLDTDRVTVIENWHNPSKPSIPHWRVLYEWNSPDTMPQISHPELTQGSYEGIEEWYELQKKGQSIRCRLEEMPEPFRSGQAKIGVKIVHGVPLFIEGKHWGIVGIDDCRAETCRSEAELSILKTAAACIGGAIEQERTRRAQEKAERNILQEREKAAQEKAAQLKEHNQVLEQREREVQRSYRILAATAQASNILLTGEDFDNTVNRALQIIGESIDTDRIAIVENFDNPSDPSHLYWKITYEWDSAYAVSQINHPEVAQESYEGIEEWYELFSKGQTISCQLEEIPEPFRSKMAKIGVKTLSSVPIFIEDKYWGNIGIDDCRKETHRSEAELSILKTAAACIGGAIEQERTRRAQEKAERNILLEREKAAQEKAAQLEESNQILSLRDRWLEATANAANQLLAIAKLDEGINAALKMLGESLDCDRVAVMQHFEDSTGESLGFLCQLYEWYSLGTISQLVHPQLNEISTDGIAEYFVKLQAGEWIGGLIEEFPEPFRSSQIEELGVKSTYAVPIFVDNQYWGVLGIDHCREPKRLTLAEIAVFKTAASCIGSAIYRQQIQQEREQAERTMILEREQAAQEKAAQLEESNQILSLRDRWLEATANAANQLLAIADIDEGINAALKMLGESLDCDRVCVAQWFEDSTGETWGFIRLLYEWDSQYANRQILHPELKEITYSKEQEDMLVSLKEGGFVGGAIDEFPDEFFQTEQMELGVKSTYGVGIFVGDCFWGVLGIDYCRKPKRSTLPEIAVFKTAASCVGSAIYRQQIQQQKEQAELAILDERNRMAREIHDTLAQAFTGISLQLEAARNSLNTQPEAAQERLLRAKILAKEGITEARRSVRALRPEALDSGDLITALHQLIDKMVSGIDIKAEIFIEGEPRSLNPEIEVNLFRIAQEATTNTLRYAQADQICIQLIYETDIVHLQIKDNGIGFNPQLLQNQGFGLIGMRERCDRLKGNLVINSASDRGTEIIVTV
ncbi:hypothetical protein H1P_360020 [Hyella patelloides LEGE 07179]|uniref:Histidine kinase domain-containing protein n=1 Tax=Hyella patelloides LEGE 07179 TaxID=945734 RepID=A0A563VWB1_9CYAN|nr:GAF domain-containing protein [Hyella patelloides]VEP15685.1 hypothetical protein H1P_360020 [Hyella patelloides LEGE 07179]